MATTGAEIARAYIALTVKAPGIQKDIAKELGGVDADRSGQAIGKKLTAGISKTVKIGGAAIAGVLGTALVKGFGRLKAIETAQAKMRGLGHDADTVKAAMDNALASVKGTAFGLGDAATAASQLMAAGIKPGQQLETVLKAVANNAAAAGIDFGEMGSIFAKAASQANGIQNDVLSQLADKGIPIYQALADQMGVTAGEVFKLASSGKINFETFQKAATAAAGTVADEMGNTTTGAFDNMMAALGRLGAKILEDVFPLIGPLFQDVTAWLDTATTHVEPLVQAFGSHLRDAFSAVKDVFAWLQANGDWLGPVAVGVTVFVGIVKAVQLGKAAFLAYTAAVKGAQIATFLSGNALKIYTAITSVQAAKTKIATAATAAWNAVTNANPIMLVVTAVAALVAGLVYFFTQTETGKRIWGEFTRFLGEAWANVSSFFRTVYEDYLKPVFDGIGAVAKWVFESILQPAFLGAQIAFAILGGIFAGVYEAIIKPIFDGIGVLFRWLYQKVVVPIVLGIRVYLEIWATALKWLWNTVVKPVFDAIGRIFDWIYRNVIMPIVLGIKLYIEIWANVFKWLWSTILQPIFKKIGEIFDWIYKQVIAPVVSWIRDKLDFLGLGFRIMWGVVRDVWDNVSSKIRAGWDVIRGIIDTLARVVQNDPKKAFEMARDAIGKAWAGIQDLAKKPVRFVVDTVINGLIGTINKIPGVNIPKVSLPKGFAGGGIIPGYDRMKRDTVLTPMRKGEGVLVPEVVRALGPGFVHGLNAAGNAGGVNAVKTRFGSGLARGGFVHPMPGAFVTTEFGGYPGHRGIDLAKPQGTPILAAASGSVSYAGYTGAGGWNVRLEHGGGYATRYLHMMQAPNVAVGQFASQRQVLGYEGSTGWSTGPHLHYEVIKNGIHQNPRPYLTGEAGGDAGLFDIIGGLSKSVMKQFTDKFPGSGMWIDAAGGLLKQGVASAIEWAKGKLSIGGDLAATLYDNGGWLQPGVQLVENRTGRPEPILTGQQWKSLTESRPGLAPGTKLYLVLEDGEELAGYVDDRAEGVISKGTSSGSSRELDSRLGGRRR